MNGIKNMDCAPSARGVRSGAVQDAAGRHFLNRGHLLEKSMESFVLKQNSPYFFLDKSNIPVLL